MTIGNVTKGVYWIRISEDYFNKKSL